MYPDSDTCLHHEMAAATFKGHPSECFGNKKMERKPSGRRRVFVQTETRCVLGMELERSDNAHTVKRKLQVAFNVPTEESSLICGDTVLKNDLSVVRNDSPLLLARNFLHRSSSTPCLSPTGRDLQHRDQSGPIEIIGCSDLLSGTKQLVKDIVVAIKGGVEPIPVQSGLGGAYYFRNCYGENVAIVKPTDEEPYAPNNPKGFVGKALGQPGLKRSVRVGETGFREVAAYLLDHDHFANVPSTSLVKVTHTIFNVNDRVNGNMHPNKKQISKIASLQQYIPHDYDASDHGTSSFPVAAVHRIGILDVRILNTDRHAGNLLVRKLDGLGRFDQVELFPIDHGLCLPENLEDPYFEWIHWPQASIPFSEDELKYISHLDPFRESEMLRMELPMIREACLRVLVLCTLFLKEAAAFGLCLAEIGDMMSREFHCHGEEPSELELICIEAKKLFDHEDFSSFETKFGDKDLTVFQLDCEHDQDSDFAANIEEKPTVVLPPQFRTKNGNSRLKLSKLEESVIEEEEEEECGTSKPEHQEVLHVLNVVNLVAPNLYPKVVPKVLSEVHKLFGSQVSALTRHVLKTVEAIFETSRIRNIVLEIENIVVSLASYVSLGDKNPLDTVIFAATILRLAMDLLYTGQPSLWVKNLPLVCQPMMGLLTSEGNTASQASSILNDVLKHRIGSQSLLISTDQTVHDDSQLGLEGDAIKSTCAVFENTLSATDGLPNEHLLSVISVLFHELGEFSFVSMRNIVLKLSDLMIQTSDSKANNEHLQKCIGSAVFAMGPEKFLILVPISLDEHSYTYSNIWLVPILKQYITGASLAFYMEHIVPLAKSFKKASRKVKKSKVSQDLLVRAQELWGLLPSFCRHATDTYKSFARLSDVLTTFLKKNLSMHENVSTALQILVNENKAALSPKKEEAECDAEQDSSLEFSMLPAYSKKAATRNMKALESYSSQLLHILSDLFISSPPQTRISLKGAISCLASIANFSVTKEVFMSLLKRFELVDCEGEGEVLTSNSSVLDIEPSDETGFSQRCSILEISSCLVKGANDNLVEIIYNLTIHSFQATNESVHYEAYNTLSKILKEHPCYSSKYMELIDLLLSIKPPTDVASLRSRFVCFHALMVHIVKISLEEDVNSKAFLILNEIILTLKDGKDEARKEACDLLLNISSSLRDLSCVGPTEPYHKLVSMIMGYLSGSSPHIKSGAVSALSVLVYKDANLCASIPDLVPSLLSLLHTKDTEIIKAVLGFFKVMVSCLEARELQNILSDVVSEIIRWSSVSRHHFKTKVTVIFEILIRKCGSAAVRVVTPEKYMDFLKTVLENRHGKSNEAAANDTENAPEVSAAKGSERRKPDISNTQEKDLFQQKKREGKFERDLSSKTEPTKFRSNDEFRSAKRSRHSNDTNSNLRSEGSMKGNKSRFKSFTHGDGKRKDKASNVRIGASKSNKFKRK